ncbi:hypothetical protein FDECE_12812 [Fusarium decemcellulare]|nr:hypothetical protein FDECE_12812 [Fusarium decemcellulare]
MSRPSHSTVAALPAWYYRVLRIMEWEDRDAEPEDFDQDISDLGELSEEEKHENSSDLDLEDIDDDNVSEMSYNGSDAEEYYELKELREDRKRQLRRIEKENRETEERNRRDKAEMIESERRMELEVLQAKERLQEALQQGRQPPEIFAAKIWNLYSVEYVEHLWDPTRVLRLPYIEFVRCGDYGVDDPSPDDDVGGHLYFDSDHGCSIPPFSPPKRAALERKVVNARVGIEIQFISNEYVIVSVPREVVFLRSGPTPLSAPATFTFMGKQG